MKKITAALLAVVMALGLFGCSQGGTGQGDPLSFEEANTVEGVAEYELVHLYATEDVSPPIPQTVYVHYQAPEGSYYLVLAADVTNLQDSTVQADSLLTVSLTLGQTVYTPSCVAVMEEGQNLTNGSALSVGARDTARLYYVFTIADGTDTASLDFSVQCGENTRTGTTTLSAFAEKRPAIPLGEAITTEDFQATVEEIYYTDTLNPPTPTGVYTRYQAEEGQVYLIVKMTVENLGETALPYSAFAGVQYTCPDGSWYQVPCCFEENGGTDLNGQPEQNTLAPQETGVLYYLKSLPETVQEGTVEVSLYVDGTFYTHQVAPQA